MTVEQAQRRARLPAAPNRAAIVHLLRRYRAYGLTVASRFPITSLPVASSAPQILLVDEPSDLLELVAEGASPHRPWFVHHESREGWLYLRWAKLFEFAVSPDGRTVIGRPLSRATPESFETHLLSQVLSTAMLRMGIEPLHATVVETPLGGIGILGDSGSGKSTIAASFIRADARLVTDDLMVVRSEGGKERVFPGPRRLKLTPGVARSLLGPEASGSAVNDRTRKMVVPLGNKEVSSGPVPLAAMFALARPIRGSDVTRVTIRRMSQRASFIELTKNSFNSLVVDSDRLRVQFETVASLAGRVPVFRLSYPAGLAHLPSVHDAILRAAGRA